MEPASQQEDIIMNIVFKHEVTIGLTQKLSDQLDILIAGLSDSDQVKEIVAALKERATTMEELGKSSSTP